MDWRALFLSPEGRIGRQNFWIGVAILFAANMVLGWIPLIGFVVWALSLYAGVCLYSKRLHDMGRSGWLQLLPLGVAAVLMVIAMAIGGTAMMMGWAMHPNGYDMNPASYAGMGIAAGLMALAGLIGFVFLLWAGLTQGDPGDNRYGSPSSASPLAPPTAAAPPE